MIILGITGPTGAGKTTVLKQLLDLGGEILDCDALYHELTCSCDPMRKELAERFGTDIFDADGQLQRKVLGAIVFEDEQALADLNEITHRYVFRAVEAAIAAAEKNGKCAVAIDAIALLESGLGDLCHSKIAVTADDELRVRRIMARDGIGEEYARMRIQAQKPSRWFEERCDHTLRNDGDDPATFGACARDLLETLINKEVI